MISLSNEAVDFAEDYAVNYTMKGGKPRLHVQWNDHKEFTAVISGRFTHNDTSCQMQNYRISKVIDAYGVQLSDN